MNIDQLLALMPIIVIATTAIVLMMTIAIKRNFALNCGLAACGIVIALLFSGFAWQEPLLQVTQLLQFDGYARFSMLLLLFAGLAVLTFCLAYFKSREGENEELPLLLSTALLGALILVSSRHFAAFFLGLETLSVSLFVMIGYLFKQPRSLEAAIKYLLLSGV